MRNTRKVNSREVIHISYPCSRSSVSEKWAGISRQKYHSRNRSKYEVSRKLSAQGERSLVPSWNEETLQIGTRFFFARFLALSCGRNLIGWEYSLERSVRGMIFCLRRTETVPRFPGNPTFPPRTERKRSFFFLATSIDHQRFYGSLPLWAKKEEQKEEQM